MLKAFSEIVENRILWMAVFSWAVAQIIKVFIALYKTRKINVSLFLGSGGMPSSHTAFVMSMTVAIGLNEGFYSSIFAVSAIVSMVVMYDASGVRRAAGKQAQVINTIVENIENTGVILDKKLKELLGHSPIEVAAGAVLGIVIAVLFS